MAATDLYPTPLLRDDPLQRFNVSSKAAYSGRSPRIERSQGPRLVAEVLAALNVRGQVRRQQLERHVAPELGADPKAGPVAESSYRRAFT